jgi:hypothetical protein
LLIVDDDAMVREVLVGQMEEQGYCVSQATTSPFMSMPIACQPLDR